MYSINVMHQVSPLLFYDFSFEDDKDLVVTVPSGVEIFFDNPSDPVSGGQREGGRYLEFIVR